MFTPKLLRAGVYGANDGIITTFAVVAGVAGAGMSPEVVIVLGIANMVADGISMGVGDYLGEASEQRLRRRLGKESDDEKMWETGLVTFATFVLAGVFPLVPYLVTWLVGDVGEVFGWSRLCAGLALFGVGASRTWLTGGSVWRNGLEMLALGGCAGLVAYGLGYWVEGLVG